MTSIILKVTGAKAQAIVRGPLTSGMVGIPVTIECDDAWNGLTKTLVCRCSKWGYDRGEARTILNVEQEATVAHEVMQADMTLYLGIEGYSPDGQQVIPTTWANCGKIQYGANADEDPSADPDLPVWAQLQAELGKLKQCAVTDEQISAAVEDYMSEHPVEIPESDCLPPYSGSDNGKVLGIVDGSPAWVEATVGGGGSSGGDSGETEPTTHGIIWDLVNVTSSNAVTSVSDGAALSAVLTAGDGYTLGDVIATMGGEALTGVWNADTATVTIPSVTGDVIISCSGVEQTGPVDTTAVIAVEGYGIDTSGSNSNAINIFPGIVNMGITKKYEYSYDNAALKQLSCYDAANDYLTTASYQGCLKVCTPSTNFVANGNALTSSTNYNRVRTTADGVFVAAASNNSFTQNAAVTVVAPPSKQSAVINAEIVAFEFVLSMADVDNSYAYWTTTQGGKEIFPNGVRNGDIIFAGKNTEYYGMANIDGTMADGGVSTINTLSFDDDVAQNYAIATTSIMGEDVATDTNTAYGLSADFAAVIDEVRTAWMLEYGGDYRKIPIIVSTDQHGRTNTGIFNMIGKSFSMHDISKVMNLGDTVATDWYDADEAHPMLSDAQLEAWCKSVKAVPFSKQLNVFGNHDCCYGNYTDEGNPIGTRYPDSKAHLYQYFRNIYARRTNNNGWFSVKDDAFNVKYVVYSLYQWPNGLDNSDAIHTEQMEWFIDELKADDGYDIVIVAHEPFNLNCTTATYPTNGTLQDVTWERGKALEAVINARMNKTSGTTTDGSGVSHSFDFAGCSSELLCSLHGHTHEDQYAYTEGGMLQNAFDWFANNTFFMVLIDRVERKLNVWKIEGDALTCQNYQIPLDKAAQ